MSKVHAVLLAPHEGDPHGLLAEGPCGARPPRAWFAQCCRRLVPEPHSSARYCGYCDTPSDVIQGLVLAWGGKPVPQGLDWLVLAPEVTRTWVSHVVGVALGWWPADRDLLTDHQFPGKLVLLDAEGREV